MFNLLHTVLTKKKLTALLCMSLYARELTLNKPQVKEEIQQHEHQLVITHPRKMTDGMHQTNGKYQLCTSTPGALTENT